METNCPGCKKRFDRIKDQYCKNCYENQLFKGQCLNIAANLMKVNLQMPLLERFLLWEVSDYNGKPSDAIVGEIFALARKLFQEGKRQNFLNTNWIKETTIP